MNDQPKKDNPFASVKDLRGLSGQILFGMDSESTPGKTICHFVRLETIEFADDAEVPTFVELGAKADPRLESLGQCFTKGANDCIQAMMGVMSELMTAVAVVQQSPIATGTQAQRMQRARALAMAVAFFEAGNNAKPNTPDVRKD